MAILKGGELRFGAEISSIEITVNCEIQLFECVGEALIVPTRIKEAGWVNEMPSRSTTFTPMAAESSRRSTT